MRGFLARGILSLRTLDWGSGAKIGLFRVRLRVFRDKRAVSLQTSLNSVSAGCAGGRGGRAPACAFWTFYSIWMFWGLEQ